MPSVPRCRVAEELRIADVYIHVSRNDAFPLSLAEALLCGKPVVTTTAVDLVSWPEIGDLPHVLLVPSGDPAATAAAMERALESLSALRSAAQSSVDRLKDFFSWRRIAAYHLERYDELLRAGH